jgi:hypothetical protein
MPNDLIDALSLIGEYLKTQNAQHIEPMDAEKVASEVLKLVVGHEETVVALTDSGPVRMERWLCRHWSLRANQLSEGQNIIAALWLRYTLSNDVDKHTDKKIVNHVVNTDAYKIIKEESEKLGVEGEPYMRRYNLRFVPAELKIRKIYRNRVVFSLHPCDEEVDVTVVRVFQPSWHLCRRGEPEDCPRRRALTEAVKSRGLQVEDIVDGVYVPIDVSDLVTLLQRVL